MSSACPIKPPLLVLLGAGASCGLGVPSTQALTTAVWSGLASYALSHVGMLWPHPVPGASTEVDRLRAALDHCYEPADFEHVLHALEAINSLSRTWDGHALSQYRLSKRAVRELLSDFLGIELSLGSVANVEQQASDAVDKPVVEAREHVRQSSAGVNANELGKYALIRTN